MGLCLRGREAWGVPGFTLGVGAGLGEERCAGMGELVNGVDSRLGGWAVRVCACVTGRSAVSGLGGV